jgi:hypothetical protein
LVVRQAIDWASNASRSHVRPQRDPAAEPGDHQPTLEQDDDEEEPAEGVAGLVDELRGRIADALAPEAADGLIASGPGYEVLASDPGRGQARHRWQLNATARARCPRREGG